MLRNDASYPYPVIRTSIGDFCKTVFNDDIQVISTLEGYRMTAKFSVNNPSIQKMIDGGVLKFAVSVTCKSTLLRKMYYIEPNNPVIEICAGDVHYQVNYVAYIIAAEDILSYDNEDFAEDYKGIEYRISKGSVLGIGTPRLFKALYEQDQINDVSSIIAISGSDTEKYMKIDLENSQIKVILPKKQSITYKNCYGRKDIYPLLHSVVTIPALMEAIKAINEAEDGDEMLQRPWCITLQQQISKLAKSIHEDELFLYEDPLRTAQIIMNNNSGLALKAIEKMV